MTPSRLAVAALLGVSLAASCATRSSDLARNEDDAGAGGSSGSSGQSGQGGQSAGQGGTRAGSAGVAGQAGASGAGAPAGSAGATAAGAAGDSGAGGAGGSSGSSGQAGQGGQPPVVVIEPDGPPEFRFLDGVTDVPAVQLCLVPWGPGGALGVDSTPQPSGGLAYGDVLTPTLPAGFDAATTALRPYVVGGDLDAVKNQGCLALVAKAPTGVKATGLAVLPAGALTAPRSRLAVATGCLGGFSVPDPIYACGTGIDPFVGNAGLVLVELSRTAPASDRLGLQFVQASAATGPLRLQSVTEPGATTVLVGSLGPGQIAPRPPLQIAPEGPFGLNPNLTQIKLQDGNQGNDLLSLSLATSLADSGLTVADLAVGQGLVAVVLGPRPGGPASDAAVVAPTRLRWLRAPKL